MQIPTLETERLTLRGPKPEDFEAYAAFRASDRTAIIGGPYTRGQAFEQLAAIIGHWTLRGFGRWIIADKTSDTPLGVAGPFYPETWPEPEIAWSVFETAEGKGIAFEAAKAARRFAYEVLGWTTAISCIDPTNTRSVALAQRLKCTPDGQLDHPTYGHMHIWRHPGPDALTAES